MAAPIELESLAFDPADARAALDQLPTRPAVFALYGAEAHAEPYIGRTPNLRGRLERLLQPSAKHPRRLQLAGRVRQIRFRLTGSEFESLLAQFSLLEQVYGPKALERMHLRAPAFVRFLGSNAYPRITVTHRPGQREAEWAYGPFASRAAAERYADEALKLFLLRRCIEELDPDPSHPGCVYSEMKMCLAPCYQGCTDERYGEEAASVEQFLATRGESRLVQLRALRDEASANLEFETAAAIHAQVQRVESVRALAPELVRPLSQLRAVILQASAEPGEVAVFLYEDGQFTGPAAFSTLGMRIQNEQSGSTSLFAQPMAIEP
ncbi:MAG: UvrB/UvrC motif-containing protein, partial [Terracidiphilus sp.]